MNCSPGILIPLATIIITLLLTWIFAPGLITVFVQPDEDESHDSPSYRDCVPSICGNSTIRYPFGKCGVLSTQCMDNHTIIFPDIDGRVVGDITKLSYSTRTLQIVQHIGDDPVWNSYSGVFDLSKGYITGSIYYCTQQPMDISQNMTWLDWGEADSHYLFSLGYEPFNDISGCTFVSNIAVPADKTYNISADKNFEQLQKRGFQITWLIHQQSRTATPVKLLEEDVTLTIAFVVMVMPTTTIAPMVSISTTPLHCGPS